MVEVRVIVEVIFGVEVRVRVKVRVMQYPTPSGYDFLRITGSCRMAD